VLPEPDGVGGLSVGGFAVVALAARRRTRRLRAQTAE